MKTTIRYNAPDKAANEAAALKDCRVYLGKRFNKVCGALAMAIARSRTKAQAYRAVQMNCGMFLGIEGYYPVRAMFREAIKHLG